MSRDKSFVDQELDNEMGYFKEPSIHLQQVEDGAMQAIEGGDHDRALFLRMQALALAKLCYEDPTMTNRELILAKAHLQLGSTYYELGLGDQSFFHAQKAMERVDPRKTGEGENNDMTVSCLLAVAKAMIQRGDSKCVNYLQRALIINHDLHSPKDITNYSIHESYGDFYVNLGDSRVMMIEEAQAKLLAWQCKSIHIKAVDPTHTRKPIKFEKKLDDYDKAIDEYRQALELLAPGKRSELLTSSAPRDPRMASIYSKMAKTRTKQGDDQEAIQLYEHSIACYKDAPNLNKAKLAQQYYELGVIHHRNKKYTESMEVLDKAVQQCQQKEGDQGEQEPLLLLVKKQQAITLYDGNEVQSARAMFEELMALQCKAYGESSVIVAETLKYLGDVYVALKKWGMARKNYGHALQKLKIRLGTNGETVQQLELYISQLNLERKLQRQQKNVCYSSRVTKCSPRS